MDINDLVAGITEQAKNAAPIGDTIKFLLDDQPVFIDGTGESNVVTTDDKEASCVIITTSEVFEQLKSGDLNPMMAVMGGKVKIKGNMGLAMKLQSLL